MMKHDGKRKFYWSIIPITIVLAIFFTLGTASAGRKDLDNIRSAIKAKNHKWVADTTSVSGLSLEQKKNRAGMNMDEELAPSPDESTPAPDDMTTAAPATLDWRSFEGINYVSPVKNQGNCGSCWAFATTAALESQVMLFTGGSLIDLSEQILVSCSGTGTCSGGSSLSATGFIQDVGLPVETCLPYTATDSSCNNACADWVNNTFGIVGWHRASSTTITVDDIKTGLYLYGPVVATMYVYNDFYYYRTGIYKYTTGSYIGAHAVLVVGYDDFNQCFIVKNSWGTGWGEAGYFKIAYSEVGGTSKFGYSALVYEGHEEPIIIDPVAPAAEIASPTDGSSLVGIATISVATPSGSAVSKVEMYVDGALFTTDSVSPFSYAWDTAKTNNGNHSLKAVAYDASGNTGASSPVTVNVANLAADETAPIPRILSPTTGTTVSKTVKVKISATDDQGLAQLSLYCNEKLLRAAAVTGTSVAMDVSWNTSKFVPKSTVILKAVATDTAGNEGTYPVNIVIK